MQLSRFRVILFALLLSIVALWINEQQGGKKRVTTEQADAKEAYSWQSTNSITWQIDRKTPEQQTIIETESFRYQETSKHSEFTLPVITLIKPGSLTVITSQKGQSFNDNIINLSGDVLIKQSSQKKDQNLQQSTLSTENITYNAKQAELVSRDTITIKQETGTTTGDGLKANLDTGHYKILSNVQGTYYQNTDNKAE